MSPRVRISVLLLLSFFLVLADNAQAWPRFRRRGNNSSYSGSVQVATKVDRDAANRRALRVYYDYDKAKATEVAFGDKIRVFLRIEDEKVFQGNQAVVAEVKLVNLEDPDTTHVKWYPVSLKNEPDQKDQLAEFDVANEDGETLIAPAQVYRLFVSLHREAAEYNDETALGRVPTPYYVATSGDTVLDKARQQIAMRTFREFYYTERGWNRNAEYPMNCHEFYCWATGFCTVATNNGRTNVGRLFRGQHAYRNGSSIRAGRRRPRPRRFCGCARARVHVAGVRRRPRPSLDDGSQLQPHDRSLPAAGRLRLDGRPLARGTDRPVRRRSGDRLRRRPRGRRRHLARRGGHPVVCGAALRCGTACTPRRPERGRVSRCRNSATGEWTIQRLVGNSSLDKRPKFRRRFQLLVPAYNLMRNPG